jgi:Rrf2 family iron-sulfur cluster assembly transcriptional regulator
MLYSQTSQYAIRALIRLYRDMVEKGLRSVSISQISEEEKIPRAYLARIFHMLARAKILGSQKGLGGGFYFKVPPEEITLWDIVKVFDDVEVYDACVIGWEKCSDEKPCSLHEKFKPLRESIKDFLMKTSLAQMVEAEIKKGLYKKRS